MYRPPSVRNFKKFVGELTAEAAGTHVAVLQAEEDNKTILGWEKRAKDFGVILSGVCGEKILKSQIRLSIVSIYAGFDLFVEEITKESKGYGFDWVMLEKVSPLEIMQKNFIKKPHNKTEFRYSVDCVDYYRLARNSVAHPSEENKKKAVAFYSAKNKSLNQIRQKYELITAPNSPDELSFHDVKFLCRILIDLTEEIASLLEPNHHQYFDSIPINKWTQYGDNLKAKARAAKAYLITEYGISQEKAKEIVKNQKEYDPFA